MKKKWAFIFLILVIIIGCSLFISIQFSPKHQAKETVELFYNYEQDGDFSDSWALFHSQMKNKFNKGAYIQDRAHVFMNHFGVETFDYELGDVEELSEWNMSNETEPLNDVYRVSVIQYYKSKYGNLQLSQEIFVTKEEDVWKVLWDYN
ncbi:hypothetical protein [Aquibacillus kalidii]|uniref:hypothetical protein n=1 Tax=Aquibacillus kalidii TaxID=2762597 RepID=UPI0016494335|nr:hypothetical protein [Aquibacillus kalidii]